MTVAASGCGQVILLRTRRSSESPRREVQGAHHRADVRPLYRRDDIDDFASAL
jgi:hypothetical protein